VLQILAELGVVGLILFGAFVWSALRHASLRRLREDPLMVCVLVYLATGAMGSMFAKELTGGRKLFFAVGLLALRPAAQAVVAAVDRVSAADPEPLAHRRTFRHPDTGHEVALVVDHAAAPGGARELQWRIWQEGGPGSPPAVAKLRFMSVPDTVDAARRAFAERRRALRAAGYELVG
jgi:hypothetical protein